MKDTQLSACVLGGCGKFTGDNKQSADNMNNLIASDVDKALKIKENSKATAMDDSGSDDKSDYYNF